MKILKPIELIYNVRLGIIKMLTKGSNDVNSMKFEKLKNDYNNLEIKNSITDLEIFMKYKKTLRKTKLITFFIFFGFTTSISLTLAGTNKIDFFSIESWKNTANVTYCAIIFFLQSIIYITTSRESTIKKRYYNHYWGFKFAQYFIVCSSIYYNFRFFMMYFSNMNPIEIVITIFICAGLDIVTIKLIALKNDMKNNIQSYKNVMNNKDITLQEKKCNEDTLQNSLHYITEDKNVINKEKVSLQKNKNSLQENNVMKAQAKKYEESNQSNEDVTSQKTDNTLQNKTSLQNTLQKEKCNEDKKKNVMSTLQNTLQKEKCNEDSLHYKKDSLQKEKCNEQKKNDSLQNIAKQIDEYIILKYRIDDLVTVKEIKEKFRITQQRKWQKIIENLESAKIINGRLRRIQANNKDNIKRVK